jgi:hypothetical protein
LGRLNPFATGRPNGRNRRNLAVHKSVDEGRVAALLRTSIIAACTTYALASRLRASWTEARATDDKAFRVVAPLDDLHAEPRYFCYRGLPRRWGGRTHFLLARTKPRLAKDFENLAKTLGALAWRRSPELDGRAVRVV